MVGASGPLFDPPKAHGKDGVGDATICIAGDARSDVVYIMHVSCNMSIHIHIYTYMH